MIGLAYALKGEIRSMLRSADAKPLETASGAAIYEIEPGILAYLGGVGKVNAAMSTQLFIDRYHPDWIVNAGCAGSFLDLPIGTIVLAKDFVQHDVDTTAMGDPIGLVSTVDRVEFPTDEPERLSGILAAQGVEHQVGRVATGEVFMTKGDRADWVARPWRSSTLWSCPLLGNWAGNMTELRERMASLLQFFSIRIPSGFSPAV